MSKKSTRIKISDDSDELPIEPESSEELLDEQNEAVGSSVSELKSEEIEAETEVEPEPTEEEIEAELAEEDMLHEPEEELDFSLDEADKTDDEEELDEEKGLEEVEEPAPVSEKEHTSKTIEDAISESETSDIFKPDPAVDAAVDDIVRTESDETIAEADAKIAALTATKEKKSFKQKISGFFVAWWNNKPARFAGFAVIFALFTISVLLPTPRYAVLNLFGVRATSSMSIVDSQTRLPLQDITVNLQGQELKTNDSGYVEFSGLKLGKSQLTITKRGYADDNRSIVLGWGSNPLGDQGLVATGEQFTFILTDWLSGEPVTKAKAISGENNALADESGKIILTIGEEDIANVEVSIESESYRTEILTGEEIDGIENKVSLTPSKKHIFVSNRNGQYDLFKIDVDTKNEEILLEATGKEREVPTVLTHPLNDFTAFVSSRDGEENEDGFILDGLFIVDDKSGEVDRVGRSEQLQLVGWSGDSIVFSQVVEGTSRGNAERSKIVSYNYVTKERVELAAANYFNDVELVGSTVYYAVSSFAVPQSQAKLYSVQVDGTEKQKVVDSQVWTIYRKTYDTLVFNAINQKWFQLVVGGDVEEVDKQNISPRRFVESPDGSTTAWSEVRDGKGVLLKSSTGEFDAKQVLSLAGLEEAQYWPNNSTLVFRVVSNSETADYIVAMNKENPEPRKITDVTATQRRLY